jgi:hypothetical protein
MPKAETPEAQLASFVARYKPEVASLAEAILKRMRQLYPTALELVYDNYNALAVGFGPTERPSEAIFSIALFPKWASLFFLQAKGLPDPERRLRGSGHVARHIRLPSAATLDDPAVRELMQEAETRASVPFDPQGAYRLIIKSISAKQRPRQPVEAASRKASASPTGLSRNASE